MERSTSEKLRLGVFVVLGSALLVIAVYLIGSRQNLFGSNFALSSVFRNVNGLQEGNNVRFSGVNVGTVKSLEILNDTAIRVNMVIDEELLGHMRKDAIATVGSDGLVGSMIINIVPGKGSAELVEPGDELRSYSRVAAEDMLNTLSVSNENIAMLTTDLLEITGSLTSGKGTLGALLRDTSMADDVRGTLINLHEASHKANAAIGELNELLKGLRSEESIAGILLDDPGSARKVRHMITGLDSSSSAIVRITTDLASVAREMKEGRGALHYLSTDSGLVIRLDSTIRNIQEGSVLLNEDLRAIRHNFLFRGYFKKQEKEQRKAK